MPNESFIEKLLAYYCVCTTLIRFTIPFKDILEIYKTRVTHKFPYLILISTIICSIAWTAYFSFVYNPYFIVNGLYGIIISSIYLVLFTYCTNNSYNTKLFIYITIAIFPIVSYYFLLKLGNETTLGVIAVFFNTAMFVSPLQKITNCIKEKDNSYLPIRIIALNFCSSLGFILYTLIYVFNIYVMIPHSVSIIISLAQIFIWDMYKPENLIDLTGIDEILKVNNDNNYLLYNNSLSYFKVDFNLRDSRSTNDKTSIKKVRSMEELDANSNKIIGKISPIKKVKEDRYSVGSIKTKESSGK